MIGVRALLLQFTVENYRSFQHKCVLSMEAAADKDLQGSDGQENALHEDHVVRAGKDRVLRTAAIFGANAAGKSNIFKALTTAIRLIRSSNMLQMGEPLTLIEPFRFSEETTSAPSSFEFVFFVQGKKYVYGFSATKRRIMTEYLYIYNSYRPTTIFTRDAAKSPEYHFTNAACRRELAPIIARNTDNKLFLATATAWNSKVTAVPFSWFQLIDTYSSNYNNLFPRIMPLLEDDKDQSLKAFICRVLHEADINIQGYTVESREVSDAEFLRQFPSQLLELLPTEFKQSPHRTVDVRFQHHITADHDEIGKEYTMDLRDESDGTVNLFMLSPVLKQAFEEGRIVCVDEFDNSLHPLLVLYLVGLFHNPAINRANAQLIISSHTMDLLSEHIMRRDQIYFVEKDQKTGASELYSLDEFQGTSRDIRKAYLLGRYGAIPTIQDGELPW